MKAITICQPHAWAVIHCTKVYENRTWPTRYRGPLLIHAGKSKKYLTTGGYPGEPAEKDLVFGAIIGVVQMVNCLRFDEVWMEHGAEAAREGYAEGPWCHVYADRQPLVTPVPCNGERGLWEPTPDLINQVFGLGQYQQADRI